MSRHNGTNGSNGSNGHRPLPFIVRRSRIQGRGAFATRRIHKGGLVGEYIGERLSHDEAESRYDEDSMLQPITYLFTVDDEVVIDASRRGNAAKYINHSCEPNCESLIDKGRVFVYAMKNIQPGVELTYDYNLYCEGAYGRDWKVRYACHCASRRCRGTLLRPKKRRRAK